MKIDGNAVKIGHIIEHQDRLWRVMKTQHVKPGKGGAYNQVELKDIRSGTKMNERFRSSETVEKVRLEQKPHQYLYHDDMVHFLDQESFEQISLLPELVGEEQIPYLQDGMVVEVEFFENEPLSVTLPETVILEISEADAVVKGQTASSSYKPAILENGVKTLVPPYIEAGSHVVIRTSDGSFIERAKTN